MNNRQFLAGNVLLVALVALSGCGSSTSNGLLSAFGNRYSNPSVSSCVEDLEVIPISPAPGSKFSVKFKLPTNRPNVTKITIRSPGANDDWKTPQNLEVRNINLAEVGSTISEEFTAPQKAGTYEILIEVDNSARGLKLPVVSTP